ncbi:hypothetical protein [Streptomyces sp. NPDC098101]|uniref:hypothetical protein n=1 Tax=Streptomyces sp. NPDC098101 TaxID=3366096 RepID=UPI00382D10EE
MTTPGGLPHHQELLDSTDWASLGIAYGTGASLPEMLTRLLDVDPDVREAAADAVFRAVNDQNTVYEAAAPVALYVAAVLDHPVVTTDGDGHGHGDGTRPHRPTLVRLLEGLGDLAHDADDERVALGERRFGKGFLDDHHEMRALRDLRPVLFSAVRPLLGHENADVRDTALAAAISLSEHPALGTHRGELIEHARHLLATSPDSRYRDLSLDALKAWGQDISGLENASDVTARELRDRRLAEINSWRTTDGTGGCAEDPPF